MKLPPVYPILDTLTLTRMGISAIDAAEAFLEGGAEILQFRHKAFWSREIFGEAERVGCMCREAGAIFVVNDRADYAAMLGAGVHVGQDDLAPADARRVIGPDALLGFSTHTAEQLCAAPEQPLGYVAFGPIFNTVSKDRADTPAGIEGLKEARLLTEKPLVAIGGITLENAPTCWRAGADSLAIIAALLPAALTKRDLRNRMAEWLRCFAIAMPDSAASKAAYIIAAGRGSGAEVIS